MTDVTTLTAEIVAAAAANEASRMRPDDLVDLIKSVKAALSEAGGSSTPNEQRATHGETPPMPKAQWSKLLQNGKIKSLIDGKLYSTIKRHIGLHGHDPKSYRAAFGLPADFPVVSPEYSARRSDIAKQRGFGRSKAAAAPAASEASDKPARKARVKKT